MAAININGTTLVATCFVTDDPNQSVSIEILTAFEQNASIKARIVNKVLFLYNTADTDIPPTRLIGINSGLISKKLVVDIVVTDDPNDNVVETEIHIELFGLDGEFAWNLRQKASNAGAQVFYRIELNFI